MAHGGPGVLPVLCLVSAGSQGSLGPQCTALEGPLSMHLVTPAVGSLCSAGQLTGVGGQLWDPSYLATLTLTGR